MRKFDGKPLAAEPTREALSQVSSDFPEDAADAVPQARRRPGAGDGMAGKLPLRGGQHGRGEPRFDLHRRYADMRAELFRE